MTKRILITGAAGFVGHHLIEEILKTKDWEIVALVRLNHAGDLNKLTDINCMKTEGYRVKIIYHDLKGTLSEELTKQIGNLDYIAHLGSNSHVERSISHPKEFFEDNVIGVVNLLEFARIHHPKVPFLNFGTDEVFGAAPDDYNYTEEDRYRPSNPYSASKAGQMCAGHSYFVTYGLPVISSYTMNIFGERQNPEKLVPMAIRRIINDEPIVIHSKLKQGCTIFKNQFDQYVTADPTDVLEIGERHWLHARNAANAVLFLLKNGKGGEHYNVVGDTELDNSSMVNKLGEIIGKTPKFQYQDFHEGRPGHDRRYALDGTKLKEMGWVPPVSFEDSLKKMVKWEIGNNK